MKNKIIPIVFAINDAFVPYFGVALYSLKKNASRENQYSVFVFHIGMSDNSIALIEGLSENNVTVKCINVEKFMPEIGFTSTNHVSKETLYRLIIPIVLDEWEKVLWLDADMVILRDVAELYAIDIGDNVIGAVREPMHEYIYDYLKKRDMEMEGYFNSGVLLINNIKMRDENVLEKCILFLSVEHYDFPDQDSLNAVCRGKVYFLPDKWNYVFDKKFSEEFKEIKKRYLLVSEDPYIIHYTGAGKPWIMPLRDKADVFWNYARETKFYEEIIYRNIHRILSNQGNSLYARHIFPWGKIGFGDEIVIYGFGNVGRSFLNQIINTQYCTIKAICDKDYEKLNGKSEIPIVSIHDLKKIHFSKLVIAIESESTSMDVRRDLINAGINEDSIVWADYRRK